MRSAQTRKQQLEMIEAERTERGRRDPACRRRPRSGRRPARVGTWSAGASAAALAAERGEAVVEHGHVPIAGRQLGRSLRVDRRGERVVFGRRQEGAVLAVRGVGHPLAAQRMPAQVRPCSRAARGTGSAPPPTGAIGRARRASARGRRAWRARANASVAVAARRRPGCASATRSCSGRSSRAESSACGRRAAGRSLPGRCRRTGCSRSR